ncbi:MAG TPA: helix-turn-helix domain-containing protein [Vicinamibacterales bacterium]|nr:helix-turn-helix domain-containing protein [Vicinamibacterales bacterium]
MDLVLDEPLVGDTDDLTLLRAPEVAHLLGLSRAQIYAMMSGGALPTIRIGRAIRVPKHALADWIRQHTHPAHTEREGS